jgi:ribosomal protein S18 acetylase RimI-like enzyme
MTNRDSSASTSPAARTSEAAPAVTVRRAELRDAATIAVFNLRMAFETEQLRLNPSTLEHGVRAVFADERRGTYFVAEHAGVVIGCLLVTHEWSDWRNGDVWWLQSVFVDAEHRRRGAFRAMYAHVEALARASEAVALRLYLERHNVRARETYASLGFEVTEYDVMHRPL